LLCRNRDVEDKKKEGEQVGFNLFVWTLLAFIVGNFIFFWKNPIKYHLSLRTLRKALYSIFLSAVAIGIIFDEVSLSNWQFLLTLTTIVVFMDLAVLLTPSIMKIWNAEFQYTDYVENTIKENAKIQTATVNRIIAMSNMIQKAEDELSSIIVINEKMGIRALQTYLEEYGSKFGFSTQVFPVESAFVNPMEIDPLGELSLNEEDRGALAEAYGFQLGLKETLTHIAQIHSFNYESDMQSHIDLLLESSIVSLKNDDSILVPVFMDERDMVIVLNKDKGMPMEVDGIHVTNLTYLFYTLVK